MRSTCTHRVDQVGTVSKLSHRLPEWQCKEFEDHAAVAGGVEGACGHQIEKVVGTATRSARFWLFLGVKGKRRRKSGNDIDHTCRERCRRRGKEKKTETSVGGERQREREESQRARAQIDVHIPARAVT